MDWYGVITNGGKGLLARWEGDSILTITSAAAGTGTVSASAMLAQTALVSQKQTISIVRETVSETGKLITLRITSEGLENEYLCQQLGIWACLDEETPLLLALYQNDTGQRVPSYAASPEFVWTFNALIEISNTGEFSLTIDTTCSATVGDLAQHNENAGAHAAQFGSKQDKIEVTGLVKSDGEGGTSAATPGTDYVEPEALNDYQQKIELDGIIKGDGAGGISEAEAGTDYGYPYITGSADPTTATEAAAVGQHYFNTTAGTEFVCTAISGNTYTWKAIGSSKGLTATLPAANWSNTAPYTQTVTVTGIVTSGADFIVSPDEASAEAYAEAGIYMAEPTAANSATFYAETEKPTTALTVKITKIEVN